MLRDWPQYEETYRIDQIKELSDWIVSGRSGCLAGLPGIGKSNLLNFLCYQPQVMRGLLAKEGVQAILIPINVNDIPENEPSVFYRVLMRSIVDASTQLSTDLRRTVAAIFRETFKLRDSFITQTALREMIQNIYHEKFRLVFVFDRFDDFCMWATPELINVLRGLRDRYKGWLVFIMGMRYEVSYFPYPTKLGVLYSVLDTFICWVPELSIKDAAFVVRKELEESEADSDTINQLYTLSGGYPSLLKTLCEFWYLFKDIKAFDEGQLETFIGYRPITYRIEEIKSGLNPEELDFLTKLARSEIPSPDRHAIGSRLVRKGLLEVEATGKFRIKSYLLLTWFQTEPLFKIGKIWAHKETNQLFQGNRLINGLSPLEYSVLMFLLENPSVRLTKSQIINAAWDEVAQLDGVADESLYQVIKLIRQKIEITTSQPRYLLTWRGKPEGGYQLFPEGKPQISMD